jgi:hypothetical protein
LNLKLNLNMFPGLVWCAYLFPSSLMIQRRLNQIVREELLHLSRKYPSKFRSVDEASHCLLSHITSAAVDPASSPSDCASSGEESDGERERRAAHLRCVYGLSAGDAERVTLLGDELRRQNSRMRREFARNAAAAAAAEAGGSGGGGDSPERGAEAGSGGGSSSSSGGAAASGDGGAGGWRDGGELKRLRRQGDAGGGGSSVDGGAASSGDGGGSADKPAAAAGQGAPVAAAAAAAAAPQPPSLTRGFFRQPFPGAEATELALLAQVERLGEKLKLLRPVRERGGAGALGVGSPTASHHQHHHHGHPQQHHPQVLQHRGVGRGEGGVVARQGLKRSVKVIVDEQEEVEEVFLDGEGAAHIPKKGRR